MILDSMIVWMVLTVVIFLMLFVIGVSKRIGISEPEVYRGGKMNVRTQEFVFGMGLSVIILSLMDFAWTMALGVMFILYILYISFRMDAKKREKENQTKVVIDYTSEDKKAWKNELKENQKNNKSALFLRLDLSDRIVITDEHIYFSPFSKIRWDARLYKYFFMQGYEWMSDNVLVIKYGFMGSAAMSRTIYIDNEEEKEKIIQKIKNNMQKHK